MPVCQMEPPLDAGWTPMKSLVAAVVSESEPDIKAINHEQDSRNGTFVTLKQKKWEIYIATLARTSNCELAIGD